MLTPRPYQLEGRDFLAPRDRALLADQMRVGKSGQALLGAVKRGARRVLVAAPAIAIPGWHKAVDEWCPDLPWFRAVSYDWAIRHRDELMAGRYDVFIPDECHFARNPEAARTQLVYGKKGLGWVSGAIWPLSGTPVVKHAGEIWAMLRAFGVVGATYDAFINHYCTLDPMSMRPTGTKKKHAAELNALLAGVMLRRTRREVAPHLPEIGFDFLPVPGKPAESLPVPPGLSDADTLTWLERHSGDLATLRIATALAKVPALVDEIDQALVGGLYERTVVFGFHREPLKLLRDKLRERGWRVEIIDGATPAKERVRIQAAFQAGAIDVLAGQIIAAGTAADFSAARHGYFLELDWLPANNAQAASRLINLELHDPVTFDVVTWPGSYDDELQRILIRRVRELSLLY